MKTYKDTFTARDKAALIPFFVLGDPDYQRSLTLIKGAIDAGADILDHIWINLITAKHRARDIHARYFPQAGKKRHLNPDFLVGKGEALIFTELELTEWRPKREH